MKKSIVLAVVVFFVVANTNLALAGGGRGRRGGGTSWGAIAGIGIIAALIGYVATRKSDVQEKATEDEYRTQRYKIDSDTTLAAPSALGDRESSEWDRPQEGRARIYSPLPARRYSSSSLTSEKSLISDDGDMDNDESGMDEYAQKKSTVRVPDIADLESLRASLTTYGATRRELQSLLHGMEEVRDVHTAMFSRRELREDLDSLRSLQEKILDQGGALVAEVAALEKLIKYLETIVSRK